MNDIYAQVRCALLSAPTFSYTMLQSSLPTKLAAFFLTHQIQQQGDEYHPEDPFAGGGVNNRHLSVYGIATCALARIEYPGAEQGLPE